MLLNMHFKYRCLKTLEGSLKLSLGPTPPWSFVSSPLEQQVANNLSSAFGGCSGLEAMLDSLDGRGQPKLSDKPAAIKRKRRLLVAKPKAKPKVKAAPKPKAELHPKSAASAAAAKPAAAPTAAPAAAPVAAQAHGLSNTRKCVHSRAYHAAAKAAKLQGKNNEAEIKTAAKAAARAAAAQWDLDHPHFGIL